MRHCQPFTREFAWRPVDIHGESEGNCGKGHYSRTVWWGWVEREVISGFSFFRTIPGERYRRSWIKFSGQPFANANPDAVLTRGDAILRQTDRKMMFRDVPRDQHRHGTSVSVST